MEVAVPSGFLSCNVPTATRARSISSSGGRARGLSSSSSSPAVPSSSSLPTRASLSTGFHSSPRAMGSHNSEFASLQILRPGPPKRSVFTRVIPFLRGSAWEQPPPDLASYLYKNRIVYLGLCLAPTVTELMLAEFLYLQYEDPEKPIYMYINSTGTMKDGRRFGYETEAFAVYDVMRYIKTPIFTLCVGNAWGEAALLLAAGAKGNRAALPSASIMIREPMDRFRGQATDMDNARRGIKSVKQDLVKLYARHIRKSPKQIEEDIRRPKYFSPSEAMEYGIIDKVMYNERSKEDKGVISGIKRAQTN